MNTNWLGFAFRYKSDPMALIVNERDDEVFIQSNDFSGWMLTAEFVEKLSKDETGGFYLAES